MPKFRSALLLAGPRLACLLLGSCSGTVDIDAIRFAAKDHGAAASGDMGPAVKVWIDTNVTEPGLFTSQYRSSSPYDVHLDYTDSSRSFEELEVTGLEIVYSDGSIEPAVDSMELPRTWRFRTYEAVNSTGTGVVRKKVSVVSGDVEGVITRDQDFALELSGRFLREDGEPTDFQILRAFRVTRDARRVTRGEFFSDV